MWLKIITNIFTIGGDLRRKYRNLEREIEILNERLEEEAKTGSALNILIEKAELAKYNYDKKPARYTLLKPFQSDSNTYQRAIQEIATNENFLFLMYTIEQDIFNMLNEANEEQATEIMGMSKGFAFVKTSVRELANAYLASMKTEENKGGVVYD